MNKSKIDPVLIPGIPFREVASVTPGGGRPRRLVTTYAEALTSGAVLPTRFLLIDEAHVFTREEG